MDDKSSELVYEICKRCLKILKLSYDLPKKY